MYKRHLFLLRALEPISHGDTLTGSNNSTNTRLFMRSMQYVDGVAARTPDISENSLRSILFREPLHQHLMRTLDLGPGSIPQSVMNLLFSGGNLERGSTSPGSDLVYGHAVKRLYPSIDLLGGAVDTFILPRSRLRLAAWPLAREFAPSIAGVSADWAREAAAVSVYDLLGEETRVRGTGDQSEGNQMLYTYETLAAGTRILVELTLDAFTPLRTESAVALALQQWDGYFGGQGRQGRGRMVVEHTSPSFPTSEAYTDHVGQNADQMREGLMTGTLGTGRVLCAV